MKTRAFLCVLFSLLILTWPGILPARGQSVERGEYLFRASGGCSCHTDLENDGARMAGGRPIETPYGVFFSTNITPDPQTGIGNWSDEEFIRAMTRGVGPDGTVFYPVFPYPAFTGMSETDLLDLKAYLFSLPAVRQQNKPHQLRFPFNWRPGINVWRWLYFVPGTFQPLAAHSPQWNRGAYLSSALAHCGECHTPRNSLGALQEEMHYAGSSQGPEGELAPNITPDPETGIGQWNEVDIVWFLQTGLKPSGDDTQGLMSEMIKHGYSYLSEEDLRAIAVYLKSIRPIVNKVKAEPE